MALDKIKMPHGKLKWILWTGGICFVGGMILNAFIETPPSMQDNAVLQQASQLPGWAFLFSVVVFAPVMEEFAFRSWSIGRRWAQYVSLVLASGFMAMIFPSFWVLIVPIAFALNVFLLRGKPILQTYIFVLLTSFLFALAHKDNMDLQHYLLAFPIYFGLALLLSYIGLRLHFALCIATHFLYNFALLMIGGFLFGSQTPIVLTDESFSGSMQHISGMESRGEIIKTMSYDTIVCNRCFITDIAADVYLFGRDSVKMYGDKKSKAAYTLEVYPATYRFYNLKVQANEGKRINYDSLFKQLLNEGKIAIEVLKDEKIIRIKEN
ncbi:MAG: CPBP family intramembrane metalloprotease [Bacteroidales bacterium]|jgi:membrane protease YdiL (CAAX protease family)|nr:CPBP family intramembrane metalloprotease [Bacteroidales bacterium]